MGRTVYHTNDPDIAAIAFAESDFFTKKINESHPLFAIKQPQAGVFLGDTDTPEWRVTHKFLPPALGPKAVRHYAPTMQKTIEQAFNVFDQFDEQGQSWNVYIYMLKLGSQAVAELTLGLDLNHFTSPNAPVHEMVRLIAETLSLNKKITSWGSWYASMPFGDPKALRDKQARMEEIILAAIADAESGGVADLPLQDAAITAKNMVGQYFLLHSMISSYGILTPDFRLRCTSNRQQGREAPENELGTRPCRCHWSRFHNNIIAVVLVNLWACDISWCSREATPRTGRQRL